MSEQAPSPTATFVLSTGRCGTQWLAAALGAFGEDRVVVEHEPLNHGYDHRNALAPHATLPAEVRIHLDRIETIIEDRAYIECGFPSWSSIPAIVDRFGSRAQVVHLTRHPVPTGYSWLTHGAYVPPLLPHLDEKILLSPFDEGVHLAHYQDRWADLGPLEKCFYYWAEVNLLGLGVCESKAVRSVRLRFEDLVNGGLQHLVDFLGLDDDRRGESDPGVVDRFRSLSYVEQDWRVITEHPEIVDVANRLGYDLGHLDDGELRRRYFGAP